MTDAHADQYCGLGVSFCAKAATLVAEEIEFLGGKAILENIFARPGTSSGFMCLRRFCFMVVVFLVFDIEYKLMIRGFLRLLLIVMNDMKTFVLSGKFLQFYAPFL